MAKIITITNGSGDSEIINDTYTIIADVVGYDNTTIDSSSITVDAATNSYAFTISANGTLSLHVTDTGTSCGTPVVGATFIRTDAEGNEYGQSITTDATGIASFNNVPYSATNAPTIYFKQTASDGDHEFSSEIQLTTLTTETATLEIENAKGAVRIFGLTDANYKNLPIETATLKLTNEG